MSVIYSALKAFKYREQLEALEQKKMAAPVHIRIKPTNVCNHRCWYCAYRSDNLQLGEDMSAKDSIPREKMREIVADLITMKIKAVTFSGGGEPLIYPYIEETLTGLVEGNIKIATLTNGSFLRGKVAEILSSGGSWVRVSMDAWDNLSLAKARGVGESEFSRIVENIENFSKLGGTCTLGVSFIINKENYAHIFDFCRIVKNAGVKHVKLSGCVVANSGQKNNSYHNEIRTEVSSQIEKSRKLEDDKFKVVDHYHIIEECFEKPYSTCPSMMYLSVIGADCRVYSCQDKAYTQAGLLGSIKNRSFQKFWFSDENLKALYAINPSTHCRHHCISDRKNRALAEYLNLDVDHQAFV